jgi:nickel-dependent lactate racemase
MQIELPWAGGTTPVEIDASRIGGVLGADVEETADPEAVLRAALTTPGAEFEDFLAGAPSPLLVVVNDGTRPTPSAEVLALLRPALEEWLKSPSNELSFVVATGTHRAALPEEIERIFGADLAEAHAERIFCHDSHDKDGLVCLARTTRGTSVWVNRLMAEAESMVLISSVEPHYFAGYTGGRKSLFPGLAGYETVWANHRLSMEAGSEYLVLAGNPVHEDLEEATALGMAGKHVYSIQLVLDKEHRVGFASAGPLEKTFEEAVAVAEKQFVLDLDRAYEVVVAAAPYPMDCNFYQTNKAIQSGALAVKEGGILIVVSECRYGLGENQTVFDTLAAVDSPRRALGEVGARAYELGVQQATRIASILEKVDIWVVSALEDEEVGAMFMTPFADLQTAVDAALARQGETAQVLLLTEASISVPRVADGR